MEVQHQQDEYPAGEGRQSRTGRVGVGGGARRTRRNAKGEESREAAGRPLGMDGNELAGLQVRLGTGTPELHWSLLEVLRWVTFFGYLAVFGVGWQIL